MGQQPGSVDQVERLSEAPVAFARLCPCGVETLVAFARVGRASTETAIAFAGEKWVFFVRFSVAEVLSVSTVAVHGRAVVMAVSCWPASAAAEVSLVSISPRRCVPCAKKFALRRCRHREGTKKFAAPGVDPKLRTATHSVYSVYRSARGRGPGRSPQHMSSDNYRNNFKALGPIMNGARIIDEPSPTPKPASTSVTQWTPRYRRVTQINTMNVSAAAHSR